jgi:hypothetical protein
MNYDGGHIELSPDRPRGLPFLKPLYAPPPYTYTRETVLMVVYETTEAAVRELLPRELEPLPGNTVAMYFFLCPDVTGLGPHNFSMPGIPVRYGDYVGQFIPYVYTSTDVSLAAYREGQGWPAVLGQTEVAESGNIVQARVTRNGREVVTARAEVSARGHPIAAARALRRTSSASVARVVLTLLFRDALPSLESLPVILYKEIPSIDGASCDNAYFLTSKSRLTDLEFKAGSVAEVSFPDPGDEPIARLEPVRVIGALYGTMDDFYPELIRVLPNLERVAE